jgi:hypothetical protein
MANNKALNWLRYAELKSNLLMVSHYLINDPQYSRETAADSIFYAAEQLHDLEDDYLNSCNDKEVAEHIESEKPGKQKPVIDLDVYLTRLREEGQISASAEIAFRELLSAMFTPSLKEA